MSDYKAVCRQAARRQMPSIPKTIFPLLEVDPKQDDGRPFIHQSGGFVMTVVCGSRVYCEDDMIYVYHVSMDGSDEDKLLFSGEDFESAWAVLIGSVE